MSANHREVEALRAYAAVVGEVGIVDWLRPNVEREVRKLDGNPGDIRSFTTWFDAISHCRSRGALQFGLSSATRASVFQTPLQRASKSSMNDSCLNRIENHSDTSMTTETTQNQEFTEARVVAKPWPRFVVQIATPSRGVFQTIHGQVQRQHRSVSGSYARSSAQCISALDRVSHIHQLRCPTKLLFQALDKRLSTWRSQDGCNTRGKTIPGYGLLCQLDDLIKARGLALQPPTAV